MDSIFAAALQSWTFQPWLAGSLLLTGIIYARGWHLLQRQMPQRFPPWRALAFGGGLAVIFLATASPLDAFAGLLLQVHMTQHLLLTMVAPPLLWLGAPNTPLLRGLPHALRKDTLGPFLASPGLQRAGTWITHPLVSWVAFVATIWLWHVPALYQLGLRSPTWHAVEHVCFLSTALLFWRPVIDPWPSHPRWPRWIMIPYLLLADIQNTIFSALFAFSERVIYPAYVAAPRLFGITPLHDQTAAGAIMWVPGSMIFLIPIGWIIIELLGPQQGLPPPLPSPVAGVGNRGGNADLLTLPMIGPLLRWRHFRRAAQTLTFLLAIAVVVDGLLGPQMSPMNLAGVLPWTYWRGFAVIALLIAGNVFCMACPFMLTRDLGRRLLPARWRWPRALRSKWLAVGLLLLYLWAYEAFGLWDSPWWTAWIVVGYFAAAFAVDGLFRGASFCKYVCPIGQFHFIQSLASPLEVKVRDVSVCGRCATFDCIRGNAQQRGCELGLFQPKKVGNLDCTFCLDCIAACPHDNVGILAVAPGRDLIGDPYRSSIGRWSRRPDIAALALLLVVGAFVNAAAMVAPVVALETQLAAWADVASTVPAFTVLLLASLFVAPALAGACGWVSRMASGSLLPWRELTCRFVLSLLPLGFSMWCAHFFFHLLTGAGTAVPVLQRVATDLGSHLLGNPAWSMSGMSPPADWLLAMEILVLDCGLLLTLYVGWRIAREYVRPLLRVVGLWLPWASVAIALYVAGVWIVFQPMQMRGMMMH